MRDTQIREMRARMLFDMPPSLPYPLLLSVEEQLAPRTNYAYLNVHINVGRGRSSEWGVVDSPTVADSLLSIPLFVLSVSLSVYLPVCLLCFLLLCARLFSFFFCDLK